MLPQVVFEVLALKMFAWKHLWFPAWLLVAVIKWWGRKAHSSAGGFYWCFCSCKMGKRQIFASGTSLRREVLALQCPKRRKG